MALEKSHLNLLPFSLKPLLLVLSPQAPVKSLFLSYKPPFYTKRPQTGRTVNVSAEMMLLKEIIPDAQ